MRTQPRRPFAWVTAATAALVLAGGSAAQAATPRALYAELGAVPERPGLAGSEAIVMNATARFMDAGEAPLGPSPFVSGLLSAVLPGTGQLAQKKSRGWAYLGLDAAAWFSFFALRNAEDQAITDAHRFADTHWSSARYAEITDCGEGLGPVDFETEKRELEELQTANPDAYYAELGRNDVYACGWDTQGSRAEFLSRQDDANSLGTASTWAVTALVLNRLVSAIDAAKVASDRRKQADPEFSWNWSVRPEPRGLAWDLVIQQRF